MSSSDVLMGSSRSDYPMVLNFFKERDRLLKYHHKFKDFLVNIMEEAINANKDYTGVPVLEELYGTIGCDFERHIARVEKDRAAIIDAARRRYKPRVLAEQIFIDSAEKLNLIEFIYENIFNKNSYGFMYFILDLYSIAEQKHNPQDIVPAFGDSEIISEYLNTYKTAYDEISDFHELPLEWKIEMVNNIYLSSVCEKDRLEVKNISIRKATTVLKDRRQNLWLFS